MFLAPYMLWGSLAAGIPIALHFFFRSRYRTVPWAAMKFLLTSIEQTSRRLRFQELLLLAMRVLVLVLLALALARPLSSTVRGAGQGEAVDAVFVFDTSYSMDARDGSQTRLQKAQDASLKILGQLPPHSTVQIITCSDRATLLGPRSPGNLDQARTLIGDLTTSSQTTDLSFGIEEAAKVLKRSQASNKELYVFSDMQKIGWDQRSASLKQAFDEIKEMASIDLVRCGNRPLKNAAIVDISSPAGVPKPGERLDYSVLVRNTGEETLENVEISLVADDSGKSGSSYVIPKLEGKQTVPVPLNAKLDKAGLRILSAQIKADDLPGDNRFDRVVEVRERTSCLIIDGNLKEKADEAHLSSSFFLHHALLPVNENNYATYWLQVRRVPPQQATPLLLAKQDFCILVNVQMPGPDKDKPGLHPFLEDLRRFVREGHGLLVYCGDNVTPAAYNRILGDMYGLLPLPMKKLHKFDDKEPGRLNRNTFNLPAYHNFKDDELFREFADISIHKVIELDEAARKPKKKAEADDKEPGDKKDEPPQTADKETEKDAVTVALRYGNGMPAVVSRKVGAGEVMLVTTAAELGFDPDTLQPTWSDWPRNRFYAPFLQVTVNHLLHGTTQDFNAVAGKTFEWVTSDKSTRNYRIKHPDGKEERLGTPVRDEYSRHVVTVKDMPKAGVYRMQAAALGEEPTKTEKTDKTDDKDGTPVAVIPDLREIDDLSSFQDQTIDERLGFSPRHMVAGSTAVQETGSDRMNREWTPLLLMALFALVVGEGLLAWWCGRAW